MRRWRKRKSLATHERGGSGDSQSKVWSRGVDAISGTEARLDLNRGKKRRMDTNLHAFKQGGRKLREIT